MNIIPFHADHFAALQLQPQQVRCLSYATSEYLTALATLGPAISGEVDGRIVACGGVVKQLFGLGTAWALFDQSAGRHFIRMDRVMRGVLETAGLRRIEATVETDFTPGCRWLSLLGFHSEGLMRSYGPNGEDHLRYARIF